MNLFEIDFYEEGYKRLTTYSNNKLFNDDDFSDLIRQADAVIENEKETNQRRAEACVRKFQLLETQYKLAPKLLDYALVLCPDMPEALTSMGCFYLDIKDRENAIACFNKAIGSDPLYPYSWLQKAYIEKDKDEEFRFLYEFIKLKPDSIIGYEKRRLLLNSIEYHMKDLLAYKKPKLIKLNLQNAIDDYSELIRLIPNEKRYYESRAKLYINMSNIEFMLSDDDNKFPDVNNNAVKDIEKLMSLTPDDELGNLITIIHNMLVDIPKETVIKYIEQMTIDLSPDTNEYWIAQILNAEDYSKDGKIIEIYTNIINSVKEGSFLQIYSYYHRSRAFFYMKEYEKALVDNEQNIKLCSLLPRERYLTMEAELYWVMRERIKILEEMKDIKGLINMHTTILETFGGNEEDQYLIIDSYMKRAETYKKNNEIQKALADYSTVIELGISGFEYNVKNAYAARIEINNSLGEMDKVPADSIKMTECKGDFYDNLLSPCDQLIEQKFEIID